jgi:hypothetical protein
MLLDTSVVGGFSLGMTPGGVQPRTGGVCHLSIKVLGLMRGLDLIVE